MMREHSDYFGLGREMQFSRRERMAAVDLILKKEIEARPHTDDFEDVYSREELVADGNKLDAKKKKIEDELLKLSLLERQKIEEEKRISDALEVITVQQVELSNWFGQGASLIRTAEYDDVFNGIDVVAEFDLGSEEKPERIALALDVSRSGTPGVIDTKIKRNTQKVIGGRDGLDPAEVKYFSSQVEDFRGRLGAVVPVVVGLDNDNLDRLISLYSDILGLKQQRAEARIADPEEVESIQGQIKEKSTEMVRYPAQKVFLEEIKMQLEMYARLLEGKVLDKAHAVYREKVKRALDVVKGILDFKEDISVENMKSDKVFALVEEITQRSSRW